MNKIRDKKDRIDLTMLSSMTMERDMNGEIAQNVVIRIFDDGSRLERGFGSIDSWCIYYFEDFLDVEQELYDKDYFGDLHDFGQKYGNEKVYNDFLKVYDATDNKIRKEVFELIKEISKEYDKDSDDSFYFDKIMSILYATMVAEENKEHAPLGKRIKRLAAHMILKEDGKVEKVVKAFHGKSAYYLKSLCDERWKS